MTTHQLANLLEHLQHGFGEGLKTETGKSMAEAISAFREYPEQPLRELIKSIKRSNAPNALRELKTRTSERAAIDVGSIIEQIRSLRSGDGSRTVLPDLSSLNNAQLKDILRAFGQPTTTKTADNAQRVKQLYTTPVADKPTETPIISAKLDSAAVEEGVRIFNELRDDRTLTITEVRAAFEHFKEYPKPVVEEISRRLKYTPSGSRADILNRLKSNLEGLKMNQYRIDDIMTGT